MTERIKGSRTVDLISDYIVVDLETTDKNVNYAEIIEIGAIKVVNDVPVDTFSTLVKPDYDIPVTATAINGITNDMVKDAPGIKDVLGVFLDFVGDSILLGHNIASYDINIIYDYVKAWTGEDFKNPYFDTLHMANHCLPNLSNHKLKTIAEYYGLDTSGEHRALFDCYITHKCYQNMKSLCKREGIRLPKPDIRSSGRRSYRRAFSDETQALQVLQGFLMGITADNILTVDEIMGLKKWIDNNNHLSGNYPFDVVMKSLNRVLEDGVIDNGEKEMLLKLFQKFTSPVENAEHEMIYSLEGMHCCVTGEFNYGDRSVIQCFITKHGGICDNNVKKTTNYVIVGSRGSDAWKHGNYGGKIKRAMELNEKGSCISIISETDFFKEVED